MLPGAAAMVALCFLCHSLWANQLVINIRAGNPAGEARTVSIRSNLPAGVAVEDVLDLDGLQLGYDIKEDLYYVHGELELGPRGTALKQVRIRDIWVLDASTVSAYGERAGAMAAALRGTRFAGEANVAARDVAAEVAAILERQAANVITRVSPVAHIRAFDENKRAVERVRKSVGDLENMALAAGVSPGDTLIGIDPMAGRARRDASVPVDYRTAMVRITVHNTSDQHARTVQIKRDMPPEITIEDILDPDGLNVRTDGGVTCLYLHNLTLEPGETRVYEVTINDKWNINAPRLAHLRLKADRLSDEAAGPRELEAVANTIANARRELDAIAADPAPETLNAAYISYYRRQAERLDGIEESLNRVEAAVRAVATRRGFDMPAPDKRTTWLVIYTILGFLAVMSLLFFLRWFGRKES